MGLQIGLAHDIHTVLVTQPVQVGIVAVMRSSDSVYVVELHLPDVLAHSLLRNSLAVEGVGVMAVDALEEEALAVDGNRLPALGGNSV